MEIIVLKRECAFRKFFGNDEEYCMLSLLDERGNALERFEFLKASNYTNEF